MPTGEREREKVRGEDKEEGKLKKRREGKHEMNEDCSASPSHNWTR